MKKVLLAIPFLLPLTAASSTLYKCTDDSGVVIYTNQKINNKNCTVLSQQSPPPSSRSTLPSAKAGSGFWVGDGIFVTNHHVVDGCKRILVGKAKTPVKLLKASRDHDLAVLTSPNSANSSVAKLRLTDVRLGEEVLISSYPLGGLVDASVTVTTGAVSSIEPFRKAHIFQTTAPIQPGSSGGPVLDYAGNVIGVVVGSLNFLATLQTSGHIAQNVNFGIRVSRVIELLESAGISYKTAILGKQIPLQEVAAISDQITTQVFCVK
jgi:S1-C subfamily serine protease